MEKETKTRKKVTTRKVNASSTKKKTKKSTFETPTNKVFLRKRKPVDKPKALFLIFCLGVMLTMSTYAWFSVNLNVRVSTVSMIVTRNQGLLISFDAIDYDNFIEISVVELIESLKSRYPSNNNQWARNGLIPVSTNGIKDQYSSMFDMYGSAGVTYRHLKKDDGFFYTNYLDEDKPREYNYYIAFDLFFRNETSSPFKDNLYLGAETSITFESDQELTPEMEGLLNSIRLGIIYLGQWPIDTDVGILQAAKCQGECKAWIYELYPTEHSELSIERASAYNYTLVDGEYVPTYATVREDGPIPVREAIPGVVEVKHPDTFKLQNTLKEEELPYTVLFSMPNSVTKTRIYIWIEGQDIDSLETDSEGAKLEMRLNFYKDMNSYREE